MKFNLRNLKSTGQYKREENDSSSYESLPSSITILLFGELVCSVTASDSYMSLHASVLFAWSADVTLSTSICFPCFSYWQWENLLCWVSLWQQIYICDSSDGLFPLRRMIPEASFKCDRYLLPGCYCGASGSAWFVSRMNPLT